MVEIRGECRSRSFNSPGTDDLRVRTQSYTELGRPEIVAAIMSHRSDGQREAFEFRESDRLQSIGTQSPGVQAKLDISSSYFVVTSKINQWAFNFLWFMIVKVSIIAVLSTLFKR